MLDVHVLVHGQRLQGRLLAVGPVHYEAVDQRRRAQTKDLRSRVV